MKYLRKYDDLNYRGLEKWKIGSNVVCVKQIEDELTYGEIYKILDIEKHSDDNISIEIENDYNDEVFYPHWRFASEEEFEESKKRPEKSPSKIFGDLLETEVQDIMDSIAIYLEHIAPEKENLDRVEYFSTDVDGVHEIAFYYEFDFRDNELDDEFHDLKSIIDDFLNENNLQEFESEFDDLMNEKEQLVPMFVIRTYASDNVLKKLKKEAEFYQKTKKFNL